LSTSDSLTPRLHKLERLLLDGDIDPELAEYLRAVGFEVRFAPRGSRIIRDDVKVLRLARKQGRILVCHDQHSDKETRLRLYPELYSHGGKILQVGGDSSQNVLTALGKILIWREKWEPWFRENDGKVVVNKDSWIPKSALNLANRTISQKRYDIGHVPFSQKRKPRKKTIRKRLIAPEQQRLIV
jgi:hypothetical protein